jgi:hypothetical protein
MYPLFIVSLTILYLSTIKFHNYETVELTIKNGKPSRKLLYEIGPLAVHECWTNRVKNILTYNDTRGTNVTECCNFAKS